MLAACTEAERAAVLKSIRLTVRDEASNPAAAAAAARRGGRPVKMMRPTASGHAQQSMWQTSWHSHDNTRFIYRPTMSIYLCCIISLKLLSKVVLLLWYNIVIDSCSTACFLLQIIWQVYYETTDNAVLFTLCVVLCCYICAINSFHVSDIQLTYIWTSKRFCISTVTWPVHNTDIS